MKASKGQFNFQFYPDTIPKRWIPKSTKLNLFKRLRDRLSRTRTNINLRLRHIIPHKSDNLPTGSTNATNPTFEESSNQLRLLQRPRNSVVSHGHDNIAFSDKDDHHINRNRNLVLDSPNHHHPNDLNSVNNGMNNGFQDLSVQPTNDQNCARKYSLNQIDADTIAYLQHVQDENTANKLESIEEDSQDLSAKLPPKRNQQQQHPFPAQNKFNNDISGQDTSPHQAISIELEDYHTTSAQKCQDNRTDVSQPRPSTEAATSNDRDSGKICSSYCHCLVALLIYTFYCTSNRNHCKLVFDL